MAKLTAKSIENLKPQPKRREIPDEGGARGLYIIVQPSGVNSFAVRYRHGGKTHKLTLPRGISLAEARQQAANAFAGLEKDRDPIVAKKAAKARATAAAANTVQSVCEDYMKRLGKELRTARDRERTLKKHVYPAIGSRPIGEIKRLELNQMLDKIEDNGGKRIAALVLAYVRKVFNWHAARDDTFNSPIVKAMSRGNGKPRDRVLSDDELQKIWKASENDSPFSAYIRFLLLTAARRMEVAALTRDEIDDAGNWTLPARRDKTGLDLVRPLSKAARDLLETQERVKDHPFIFSGGKRPLSGFAAHKRGFDKKCGVENGTLHDLRRTARTLMSRAGVNADHAERCLGHKIPGMRGVYDRFEFHHEKQRAYEALATLIERIANPPKGNVRQLRRG
jgi:integrase